jgi:hypothetical protein
VSPPPHLIDAAVALAARGLRVFPVWPPVATANGRLVCGCGRDCEKPAKHPFGRLAPKGCHSASNVEEAVRRWWTTKPDANIAIATGPDVTVLDVDQDKGGRESLQQLEAVHGELPLTWRTLTGGGGEHVYFAAPPGGLIPSSVEKLAPGLDVRGAGGYVVAPPSVHISGRSYAWSIDHHPDDVALAPTPQWLAAAAGRPAGDVGPTRQNASVWRQLAAGVSEGARNNAIAKFSGHLLRRDVDAYAVLELMRALNVARFRPPLTELELTGIVGSIARRELRRRGGR